METLFEIFILRFGLRKRGEIRGVADSFSGGSPDLKNKLKKLKKKLKKTEKIGFFPNKVSKKRCFSVFVS